MRASGGDAPVDGSGLTALVAVLVANEIGWDQASSVEARDFCCWIGRADKPWRRHWRYRGGRAPGSGSAVAPGTPKPVTGKRWPGRGYAAATVVQCEVCCASFTAPLGGRRRADGGPGPAGAGAAGPGEVTPRSRAARSLPSALAVPAGVARGGTRQIPEKEFGQLFARRAGTGTRRWWHSGVDGCPASELLGATTGDADPGQS